ncbi:CCAAT/enhancer-binding protein gamma [Silurus meridionalis]|nr:CCAAT/enhancer-binding protein gamma [Silurus meridionalis]
MVYSHARELKALGRDPRYYLTPLSLAHTVSFFFSLVHLRFSPQTPKLQTLSPVSTRRWLDRTQQRDKTHQKLPLARSLLRRSARPYKRAVATGSNQHFRQHSAPSRSRRRCRLKRKIEAVDPNEQAAAAEVNQHRSERSERHTEPGSLQRRKLCRNYSRTTAVNAGGGGKATPSSKMKKTILDKESDEYRQRRERNNLAVKKSRMRSKQKAQDTQQRVNELKEENERLEAKIKLLSKELSVLKDLFLEHAHNLADNVQPNTAATVTPGDLCNTNNSQVKMTDAEEEFPPDPRNTSKSKEDSSALRQEDPDPYEPMVTLAESARLLGT